MNKIRKIPLAQLGYDFIEPAYLPEDQDEYYLRNLQNRSGINYRQLSAYEIEVLVRNRNTCDNWNNFLVSDAFNPELVKNCKFYGLVRIGKLEPYFLEYSQLKIAVGLYNSTIISCDFGDNVVIDNVNYLSHYIIGSEVIIVNVNELMTTPHAKFGNGVLKDGESESVRIWMELCNENAGRKVLPFNGMQAGDAWMWSKYRNDHVLLQKFQEFTEKRFDTKRGYYGKIGDRTVIKNCAIIKDVWIGSDAYLKGANKLKNLTINSQENAASQIGEGCELVNGIVGFGCRIFYGVKAVRFVLSNHSQLKYGARLINSFLGPNSTISCCEVLNSLIFPAHEQHHNNSFLCAATVMGQSNMAAGATIGSNHNSRSPDGEMQAGRGFWPGLCVSLKHNSRFASFTMIAKGDYQFELDIPLPFSLISQNTATDSLQIMPAYWFMHNMYALARNAWKYTDRDKRIDKTQHLEFDYLAPDTINEMFTAIALLEQWTGAAWYAQKGTAAEEKLQQRKGAQLLHNNDPILNALRIEATGLENSKRKVIILKAAQAWQQYRQMIRLYGITQMIDAVEQAGTFRKAANQWKGKLKRTHVINVGGQLIPEQEMALLIQRIHKGTVAGWNEVHAFYATQKALYPSFKLQHALASFEAVANMKMTDLKEADFKLLVQEYLQIKADLCKRIETSRAKDYSNTFRKMMYNNDAEMNEVIGKLEDNAFILQEKKGLAAEKRRLKPWLS
ncbi:DUF4954 family protein [Phnomibacter sp. MR]|uniref:DUF4954 family protein n=1 Tax=Phnomibacter sp. MR TaxID=3042318 RepID=UPI003A803223